MKAKWFMIVMMFLGLSLSSCKSLPPVPTNDEILQAVIASNEMEAEPLDLVWDEMEVPQRSYGRAAAVLWVPDNSIQRNFRISYDNEEIGFYVESYTTQILGEDGVYRTSD